MATERFASLPPIDITEAHCPTVILSDGSGSMGGIGIQSVNAGLAEFGNVLKNDEKAAGTVDVEIISFNDTVNRETAFTPAAEYQAPTLRAEGCTAFNQALITALQDLRARKDQYKTMGVSYFRPIIFAMTDGLATDSEHEAEAKRLLNEAYANKGVTLYVMAVGSADVEKLRSYLPGGKGKVLKADYSCFKEALIWFSNSMVKLSNSDPSLENVKTLPTPACVEVC